MAGIFVASWVSGMTGLAFPTIATPLFLLLFSPMETVALTAACSLTGQIVSMLLLHRRVAYTTAPRPRWSGVIFSSITPSIGLCLFIGLHLPLTRQSTTYAREGIELDVSTLADWVGASAATLMPLVEALRAYVFAAERLHADDTTVPVLDVGKTRTGRLWAYVRDDRPFAGRAPPAAIYFYSPDRTAVHPEKHLARWQGLMQADAYSGFNRLYEPARQPGPIVEVACWAHARRYFFDLARLNKAPIGIEAVARIDALFAIEREINGAVPAERQRVRQERSKPLVDELGRWLREQYGRVSPSSKIGKAIAYSLNHWNALVRFLDDGRLCMSNNAAERAMRPVATGRRNWTFAGSDEGGHRAAAIYTLIETAKLNDVDPLAWLTDVLARLQDHHARRIDELLPWHWKTAQILRAA
jgi:transposase